MNKLEAVKYAIRILVREAEHFRCLGYDNEAAKDVFDECASYDEQAIEELKKIAKEIIKNDRTGSN